MNFQEAYVANETKKVRRSFWWKKRCSHEIGYFQSHVSFTIAEIFADDWEVVEEPKVIELEWDCTRGIPLMVGPAMISKRWKVVCTEVVE